MNYSDLLQQAVQITDELSCFIPDNLGAPSKVFKGKGDFATEIDLDIEKHLVKRLTAETGIPTHGEEYGGVPVDKGKVWVVDPIDGTSNFSSGLPLCGTLIALLEDGQPMLGVASFPITHQKFYATTDGPLYCNGKELPPLKPAKLSEAIISSGSFQVGGGGEFPGAFRAEVLSGISHQTSKLRLLGCAGAETAFVASGILGGAVLFGHNAWDNSAGAALIKSAGGVATDLAGNPWHAQSRSLLGAAPGIHEELRDIIEKAAKKHNVNLQGNVNLPGNSG